ncbi:MAG: hypothetical protein KGZ96_05280 [Clostridia bacterium]|nr:hypothetical protein [Clostridia bacterium]
MELYNITQLLCVSYFDTSTKKFKPSFSCSFSLEEVIIERFKGMKVPVLYNLACGHGREKLTLPMGVAATLDADSGILYLREGAVKR